MVHPDSYVGRFLSLGASFPPHNKNHSIVRWVFPPPRLVKLNFDGSCRGLSTSGGFMLKDWAGCLLWVVSCNYGTTSITVAEARAMRDGILMAIQAGFRHIFVEGDNKMVIQPAQGFGGFISAFLTYLKIFNVGRKQLFSFCLNTLFKRQIGLQIGWLNLVILFPAP